MSKVFSSFYYLFQNQSLMKRIVGIAVAAVLELACSNNQELMLLIGTYTEGTGARGTYLYSFNQKSLEFKELSVAEAGNPSFVVMGTAGGCAYSVNEFGDGRQGVSSYSVGAGSIGLTSFAPIPAGGEDPCNILCTGRAVVTSNYTGGSLSAFELRADGTLGALTQTWAPADSLPAHMHCAVISPDGRYIFATNLGGNCIHRFQRLDSTAPLGADTIAWRSESKMGPRHMIFSADGNFAYLICELSDELVCFRYADGALEPIQTLKAYDGNGHGGADIHLSPDGRFLYTSHRLKGDGIAVFSVDKATGLVTPVGFQATGIHPRNFTITPDGRHLLCACRDSNRIEVYELNPKTGLLSACGGLSLGGPVSSNGVSLHLASPVCVQVVEAGL